MSKLKKTLSMALCAVLSVFAAVIFAAGAGKTTAYAASPIGGEDGRYEMSYDFGGQSGMGKQMLEKYFDKTAAVEKIGDRYYFSFTQLSSSMENLSLNLESGKQIGYRITEDSGNRKTYSYTLSKENLQKTLPFSVFVSVRGETFTFTITLNLSSARRVGNVEDVLTERPAEFVPVIVTSSGSEYEATKGQTFVIREAAASLGEETLDVEVKAYYIRGEEKTEVALDGNKLVLDNAGEYHVIYRAESTRYTTSFGNPTYAEKDVKIISCIGGGDSLAKLYDTNGALPEGTMLLASRIESDSTVYKAAAEKMATIADRFQVFGVELVSADGSPAEVNGTVTIGIRADFTYNRNKVAAYLLDEDGHMTKLGVSNGGSYVNVETDKSGTIILCIPGVAFHMPIWGYILILVGSVILIAGIVVAIVLIVRHRKKRVGGK
jgi:hypothetical protein